MWNTMHSDRKSVESEATFSRSSSPDWEASEIGGASGVEQRQDLESLTPDSGINFTPDITEQATQESDTARSHRKVPSLGLVAEDTEVLNFCPEQKPDDNQTQLWQLIEGAKTILGGSDPNKYLTEGKGRTLSLQLDLNPGVLYDSAMEERRASAAEMTQRDKLRRSKSEYGAGVIGQQRCESARKTPASTSNYADADGVQLRGDKGKSRRRSSAKSARSEQNEIISVPMSVWKRHFQVPYTPRDTVTRMTGINRVPGGMSKSGHKNPSLPLIQAAATTQSMEKNHHKSKEKREAFKRDYHRPWDTKCIPKPSKQYTKHVEIYYEDFLPNNEWLEMTPRKYTKNHKHGNHFEFRLLADKKTEPPPLTKEAYVWENEYQIWMMEKKLKQI